MAVDVVVVCCYWCWWCCYYTYKTLLFLGHFGSGVVSYFTFLKHLFLTNLLLATIVILFVIIPMAVFPETEYNDVLVGSNVSTSEAVSLAVNCSQQYTVTASDKWYEYIINVLQGTVSYDVT